MFGKNVNGTFRLMSRERFMVEVGYHQQMIEVFKTMTTKKYGMHVLEEFIFNIDQNNYCFLFRSQRVVYLNAVNLHLISDVETKRWNFELSEHDKLVAALTPLRPAVCISPLPLFVRKVSSHVLPVVLLYCLNTNHI